MNIRNPVIPPATIKGGGPGEYFVRKKDWRGKIRQPAPRILRGDPVHFDRLVGCSRSSHPHLHAVLGYKNERVQPARETKDCILEMYLSLLRAGLRIDKVYVLIVDHGDHDHVAVYRHLISREWRRFQPYYHENDWLLKSDFQWLVNRRYNLSGPEDTRNAQYISLAGRKTGKKQQDFLTKLRDEIASGLHQEFFATHESFLKYLQDDLKCEVEVNTVADDDDFDDDVEEENDSERAWLDVTTPERVAVSLKGPMCQPGFNFENHREKLCQKTALYTEFLRDASDIWKRFSDGYAKYRKRNLELHPGFCEIENGNLLHAFEELDPIRHLKVPAPNGGLPDSSLNH
jgi:hypothetical protein